MLQEHEIYHNTSDSQHRAVERVTTVYFLLVGGVMSLNGFLMKDVASFSIFELTDFQVWSCLFLGVLGRVVISNVLEHRLLLLKYKKNINMNRQWFHERFPNEKLGKYTLWKVGSEYPQLYTKYRPYWWEMLGLSMITSFFLAIALVNFLKEFGGTSPHHQVLNWLALVSATLSIAGALMLWYKRRSLKVAAEVEARVKSSVLEADGKPANLSAQGR